MQSLLELQRYPHGLQSKENEMANNFDPIAFAARQIGAGRAAEILA